MALVIAVVVGGVAVATTGSNTAPAANNSPSNDTSTIHVSASGSVASNPDKAVIRLAVEATAKNASVARQRVAENVSAMRTSLQNLGLDESRIRTTDYNLYKDERHRRTREKQQAETVVYRADHELAIEVQNVSQAGTVIDTAIANGASNLHDIRFTLSTETRRQLRDKALKEAMTNARAKADTLASSANLEISGIDIVTTVSGGHRDPFQATPAPEAAAGVDSTSINSGPVTVSVSIQVTYTATED